MKTLMLIFTFFTISQASEFDTKLSDLEKRLEVLKKRLKLSSGDTSFSLGGRILFDTVINRPSVNTSGGENTYDYYMSPQSLSNHSPISKLSTQMKRSRLWFKTQKNSDLGLIKSLIEVDFYGSSGNEDVSNSHNLRLRHAYVSLNAWTLGQTYSTFMGSSMPDLFLLSSNLAFVRQPMIKYTFSDEHFKLDFALENPETTLTELDSNSSSSHNDDPFFDSIVRVRYESKKMKASVSLLLRTLSLEQNATLIRHNAWGLNTSLQYRFKNDDYLQASFAQGEGIGRYLALGYYDDAELTPTQMNLIPLRSGHLSFTHKFSKKLRCTLLTSRIEIQEDDQLQYSRQEYTQAEHLNLRYTPIEKTMITLEYIKAHKKHETQERLELDRLVLSFSYIF